MLCFSVVDGCKYQFNLNNTHCCRSSRYTPPRDCSTPWLLNEEAANKRGASTGNTSAGLALHVFRHFSLILSLRPPSVPSYPPPLRLLCLFLASLSIQTSPIVYRTMYSLTIFFLETRIWIWAGVTSCETFVYRSVRLPYMETP